MGITKLIPCMDSIKQKVNLFELKPKSVAIDGYAWLHKSVFQCGNEFFNNGDITKMANFFIRRVGRLLKKGEFQ